MHTFMNDIVNPSARMLLRSPLRGLLNRSVTVISFTGRSSGSSYAIPVQYVRRGQVAYLFTRSDRRWWRNMRDAASVTLVLPAGTVPGTALALRPEQAENAALACTGTWLERAYRSRTDGVIVGVDLK